MTHAELRSKLHSLIDAAGISKLQEIYAFLSGEDGYESLHPELKQRLLRGQKQADADEVLSHEEVTEKHRQRFPKAGL